MAKATLILNLRDDRPNGVIIVQRIHRLAEPTAAAPHGYVYQLHCGTRAGRTLVRFDNETGKGDHTHFGDAEQPYRFTTLERLLADFETAIQPYLGD
ncbi:MAG: hypothetical protein EA420_01185 [Candidatus Competibacteraceae bacterium]|nr:MAG: hypothetical protein EA420_01185 [Candidatus Competibacteraceae bacterium]